MIYRIITSTGAVYETEIEITKETLILEGVIPSYRFLDFVNKNYTDIKLSSDARSIYNQLWEEEEQHKKFILNLAK
ncbi:MAG: hypothetical protein ACRCXZ_02265 [Patescibacteria group bacterium]